MKYRKLRIAFSATCLIACVLLVVLWVQNYSSASRIPQRLGTGPAFELRSFRGSIDILRWPAFMPGAWRRTPSIRLQIPNPVVAMTLAAAAMSPWIPWSRRFSLRTLLIATTLVAVVLGLIVWLRYARRLATSAGLQIVKQLGRVAGALAALVESPFGADLRQREDEVRRGAEMAGWTADTLE